MVFYLSKTSKGILYRLATGKHSGIYKPQIHRFETVHVNLLKLGAAILANIIVVHCQFSQKVLSLRFS